MDVSPREERLVEQREQFLVARAKGTPAMLAADEVGWTPRQLREPEFAARLRNRIASAGLDPAGFTVEVDAGQMQQVLTNLVMNGLHAMARPGTLRVRVQVLRATPPADVGGARSPARQPR